MTSHYYEKAALIGVLLLAAVFANKASDLTSLPASKSDSASLLASASETINPSEQQIFTSAENGAVSPLDTPRSLAFHRKSSEQAPLIDAEAALIADLRTGEEYFAKNSDIRWPIASVTKLMTAVLTSEQLDQKTVIRLRAEDFSVVGGDLGRNLQSGDQFSVRDLLRAMLLFSSNESAEALANAYGRDLLLASMNTAAEEWGLTDTHFADPTGLSALNQSTARDLIRMTRHIMDEYPGVFAVTRLPSVNITEVETGKQVRIYSTNEFAGAPDFLGGKTGYTDEAKENLLTIFSFADRPIFVVVLGVSGDRFAETRKLRDWFVRTYAPNI
jgi:serine-type D-Ala-D-Ala endopeptidase (penicillin-binding protein 7)